MLRTPLFAAGSALLLGACASAPVAPPPPAFDVRADPVAQSAQFITPVNAGDRGAGQQVALTACNVVFGIKTGANAQTQAGMFESTSGRVDAKVSQVYLLEGVSDARMQAITDRICARAGEQLAAAGMQVMPHAKLAATPQYQALTEKGRAAPVEWSVGKADYKVFAPSGWTVFDQRFDGTARGIANIFGAATRSNPASLESRLVHELGVNGVHLDILVDFASLSSSDQQNKGMLSRLAGADEASVETTLALSVTGMLKLVTPEVINCHKLGCDTLEQRWPMYKSARPLVATETFYSELRDAESTAGKVAEGVANVLGFLAAAAGGSGSSVSMSKWAVAADADAYAAIAEQYASGFVAMAAVAAQP